MKYRRIVEAKFVSRPNRFVAEVDMGGARETVHVKNTGRCRELLLPGSKVVLSLSGNPARRTRYDLVAVEKAGLGLVNIDSQAPNKVMAEWLAGRGYDVVRPEYRYGNSRIDFYMERGGDRFLMEVKGCTLEIDGVGYFPDAPSERGVKHLRELAKARREGCKCTVAFVIQMPCVTEVRPNVAAHPEFGEAWLEAAEAGVKLLFVGCNVTEDSLTVDDSRIFLR